MTVAELYSAFTTEPSGGSHAWIVRDCAELSTREMQAIAHELGAPATGFVTGIEGSAVSARFFSSTTEYGMCGHGSIALFTCLVERDEIRCGDRADFTLRTPVAESSVRIERDGDPVRVMLELALAEIESTELTARELGPLFGLNASGIDIGLPLAVSRSDFTHLVVPISSLDHMAAMKPDFHGLAALHRRHGIETVAAICPTQRDPDAEVRVRDFCPAVGTDEAAATGTTNRVVSLYLLEHGLVPSGISQVTIRAEQGIEMGRPSLVETQMTIIDGDVAEVWVGGTAAAVEVSALSRSIG